MQESSACFDIGVIPSGEDIVARDVGVWRRGRLFKVLIGLPSYLEDLTAHRLQIGEKAPSPREVFVVDNVHDLSKICQSLHALPFEEFLPFATEQDLAP